MEGIVTLEDLLEEIVGEIEDEFDLPDETVERVDEDTIRIDGTFPIDDFNEQFQCDLPDEDYHTVAGFVFGELGRTPRPATRCRTTACSSGWTRSKDSESTGCMVTFQPWRRPDQQEDDDAAAQFFAPAAST